MKENKLYHSSRRFLFNPARTGYHDAFLQSRVLLDKDGWLYAVLSFQLRPNNAIELDFCNFQDEMGELLANEFIQALTALEEQAQAVREAFVKARSDQALKLESAKKPDSE